MKKYKCTKCKETKPEIEYYFCKKRGVASRKGSCKFCFNRCRMQNVKRKKFLEITTGVKFKKHERFVEKTKSFSSDPKSALRERDISN